MTTANPDARDMHALTELSLRVLNATAEPDDLAELDRRIRDDQRAAWHYAQLAQLCATLRQEGPRVFARAQGLADNGQAASVLREAIVEDEAIAQKELLIERVRQLTEMRQIVEEASAQGLRRFQEQEQQRQAQAQRRRAARRRRFWLGLAVPLAASLVLVAGGLVHYYFGGPPVVAAIGQSLDARWLDRQLPTAAGTELRAGQYVLEEGYLALTLLDGAEALLQAPAEFTLESPGQIYIQRGALSARVPEQAVGFIVRTPTATLVDYGTEFGVQAGASGRVDAYVFEGEVDLRVGQDAVRHGPTRRLQAGYQGAVNTEGHLEAAPMIEGQTPVARRIPHSSTFGRPGARIDLADLVAGGNGFGTGQPGAGLNPGTGAFVRANTSAGRYRTAAYIEMPSLALIDGLFVPDGGEGPQVVSSAGHLFTECPDTNGQMWSEIVAAGPRLMYGHDGAYLTPRIGRTTYGGATHPAIYMHSNAGITFDLGRMRDLLDDRIPARFTARAGRIDSDHCDRMADIFVLVDGELRFSRTQLTANQEPVPVDIPLAPADRFLTLIVTNSIDTTDSDFVLFGRPAIELTAPGSATHMEADE